MSPGRGGRLFGASFSFGVGSAKKPERDDQGRPALPEGFRYTTQDEQDAFQRRRKAREKKEFEEYERKRGRDPATGRPLAGGEGGEGDGGLSAATGEAAKGAERVAGETKKAAEGVKRLAQGVADTIPPIEKMAARLDEGASSQKQVVSSMESVLGGVEQLVSAQGDAATTFANTDQRLGEKIDRLIQQLKDAQVLSGGA